MGNLISIFSPQESLSSSQSSVSVSGSQAENSGPSSDALSTESVRKRPSNEDNDEVNDHESFLHTPKKKKIKTTTEYIYQVLFVEGVNSDVTIKALDKEWKLHKLYLRQCGFFESMFSGSWKETSAAVINLDIPDANIDAEALTIAFGCLYRDDLTIEPIQVIPVLASASLLQLDGLMCQCAAIMKETISSKTVCEYYECSVMYGLQAVEASCFEWFENNIMCKQSRSLLRHINPNLMQALIKSPTLFVMQVEMDVYNLLKRWLFLQLVPSWNGSFKSGLSKQAEVHFTEIIRQEFGSGSQKTFLETTQGSKYRTVFSCLRLQHIIIDLTSTQLLIKDRIIPQEWLMPYFKNNWLTLLNVEQGEDYGPKSEDVDDDVFLMSSLRCARVLNEEGEYQWRWIGFNFGVDLVAIYSNRLLIFKRNCNNQSRLLSQHSRRDVLFRVNVSSLNELGQVIYSKTTGIKSHSFTKDEELLCMSIDKKATLPLRISLNVLYYTPKPELSVSNLLRLPLSRNTCYMCRRHRHVSAILPVTTEANDDISNNSAAAAAVASGDNDHQVSSDVREDNSDNLIEPDSQ